VKTCPRFRRIKANAEREIALHSSHAQAYAGRPSAKQSGALAVSARHSMGRALSRHYQDCPECS
jgi:hypothetical protein